MAITPPFNGINVPQPAGPSNPVPAAKVSAAPAPVAVDVAPHIIKPLAIIGRAQPLPTGALVVSGRQPRKGATNRDQIMFPGVPFYDYVNMGKGIAHAGVPLGPGFEPPAEQQLGRDRFDLDPGGKLVKVGMTNDSKVVIPTRDNDGRKKIHQFSVEKTTEGTFVLPPQEDGVFFWWSWTGFYGRWRVPEARVLLAAGGFLHGAGAFQGSLGLTEEAHGGILRKGSEEPVLETEELGRHVEMMDGIAMWEATIHKAFFTPHSSSGVVLRQLHQVHLLTCDGGVPKIETRRYDEVASKLRCFNKMGVPFRAKPVPIAA